MIGARSRKRGRPNSAAKTLADRPGPRHASDSHVAGFGRLASVRHAGGSRPRAMWSPAGAGRRPNAGCFFRCCARRAILPDGGFRGAEPVPLDPADRRGLIKRALRSPRDEALGISHQRPRSGSRVGRRGRPLIEALRGPRAAIFRRGPRTVRSKGAAAGCPRRCGTIPSVLITPQYGPARRARYEDKRDRPACSENLDRLSWRGGGTELKNGNIV